MRSVVDGAVRVLRALPDTTGEHQIAHLAELTALPRPTVHRLLAQLLQNGLVEWHEGRWTLGSSMLQLAHRVEPVAGLRTASARVLQYLRDQTGAAVSLVIPSGSAFVALEMIPGREDLPIDAHAGADMPTSTAAALALRPAQDARDRLRPFHGAVDQEHLLPGLTCYAVAVSLPGGQRASLQIATSATRPAERFAAAVHHAGADLQRAVKSA
jgi:IclR family acetate operon transcriptional repressor